MWTCVFLWKSCQVVGLNLFQHIGNTYICLESNLNSIIPVKHKEKNLQKYTLQNFLQIHGHGTFLKFKETRLPLPRLYEILWKSILDLKSLLNYFSLEKLSWENEKEKIPSCCKCFRKKLNFKKMRMEERDSSITSKPQRFGHEGFALNKISALPSKVSAVWVENLLFFVPLIAQNVLLLKWKNWESINRKRNIVEIWNK